MGSRGGGIGIITFFGLLARKPLIGQVLGHAYFSNPALGNSQQKGYKP